MQSRDTPHPPKGVAGQISVMIAVMMTTFILFFAFVINIGMLVNAKINLQNAADLAAYAGAAVQARQLTQISYLNYEMRRQYKKYLFRTYVLGNMAEDSFPSSSPGGSGPTAMQYKPDNSFDYGMPTTCVIFNSMDNYCHMKSLPKIVIPGPSVLDAVTDTLSGQLQAIEAIRQQNCMAIGVTNLLLSLYWLYNADPTFSSLTGLDMQQSNTLTTLQGLATGLGLVPREIILRWRIKTLDSYVNAKPQMNLGKGAVDGFQSMPDTGPYERSIQAFYSAYYTLGNHTFSGDTVTLDELLPGDSSNAQLLNLKDIKQKFDAYAIDYVLDGSGSGGVGGGVNSAALSNVTSPSGSNCNAISIPITLAQELTLGVYKDPTIMTYYAIRLKAQAKILFSPFGDIQMKAYSAAQPFGSRIGPNNVNQGASFGTGSGAPTNVAAGASNMSNQVPNLTVRTQDSTGRGSGWDTQEVVGTMFQAIGSGGKATNTVTSSMLEGAYQIAMAPSPWEGTRYNIMNDQGADAFVRNFGTDNRAAFWAPIFSPGTQSTQSAALQSLINGFFDNGVNGHLGASSNQSSNLQAIQSSIMNSLTTYISSTLQQGQGEDGEGLNIVRLRNPFLKLDGTPIAGGTLFLTDAPSIKTSWNNINRADYVAQGRVGYSVKFVSFDSLTANKISTDGSQTWINTPNIDPEGEQDIPFIKH